MYTLYHLLQILICTNYLNNRFLHLNYEKVREKNLHLRKVEKIDAPEEGDENAEKKAPRRRTTKARTAKVAEASEEAAE